MKRNRGRKEDERKMTRGTERERKRVRERKGWRAEGGGARQGGAGHRGSSVLLLTTAGEVIM